MTKPEEGSLNRKIQWEGRDVSLVRRAELQQFFASQEKPGGNEQIMRDMDGFMNDIAEDEGMIMQWRDAMKLLVLRV